MSPTKTVVESHELVPEWFSLELIQCLAPSGRSNRPLQLCSWDGVEVRNTCVGVAV